MESDEKVGVPNSFTRRVQQVGQHVAQLLGLTFLHTRDAPSHTNTVLQLALQRVAAQVDRSLKSTSYMQTLRIFPALDRSCPKNRRLDKPLIEHRAHSFLQSRVMERGRGFEPTTIASEEQDSSIELPPSRVCSKTFLASYRSASRILEPMSGIEP